MFIKPTIVSWRLWKAFGTPGEDSQGYFDLQEVNECVDEYTQMSTNFSATKTKAAKLRRKFGALTVLLMIYLCLYGTIIACGVLGLILTLIAILCAKLCAFDAHGRHIAANCGF